MGFLRLQLQQFFVRGKECGTASKWAKERQSRQTDTKMEDVISIV